MVSTSCRPDRVQRVQRSQRILEDGADLAPADAPHGVVGQVVDAPAAQVDLARGDAPRRIDEADDRGAGQRLAGAGLPDHAEHLARRDLERHVVNGDQRPAARRKLDAQALDGEQRFHGARPTPCGYLAAGNWQPAIASTWSTTGVHSCVMVLANCALM